VVHGNGAVAANVGWGVGASPCASRGLGSSHDALLQRAGVLEGARLAADTGRMAKKPEPPKPIIWNVKSAWRKPGLPIGADIFADSGLVFCAEFP
jgi:hypothetical protein